MNVVDTKTLFRTEPSQGAARTRTLCIVTSIHPDFDARIWKHAKAIAKAGWSVHLVAPWDATGVEIPNGIELHPFKRVVERLRRPVLIPARISRVLRPLLKTADIIHFHDVDILPFMALHAMNHRVVYDVHEDYPEEMLVRQWVPRLMRHPLSVGVAVGQRFFARPIRNIVLTAPTLEHEFQGRRFRKLLIRNYASTELLESAVSDYKSRQPGVIFIGSQHPNNGSMLLIDIAERVQKLRPHVRFYTVDRFPSAEYRREILGEVERRKLANVELIPNLKPHELMRSLNRATIAISPNLRVKQQINGAHNKIYEFMAAGLPIVASDLPQQVKAVVGSNCGYVAQPEDPDSFAEAIVRLVDDPAAAEQMGLNGREAFRDHYSWESQMPALIDFYEEILRS